MSRTVFRRGWLACIALLAGGCGAIPDFIVDEAKSSAKEALKEAAGDAVDNVIDDTIGVLLESDNFEFPTTGQSEDEEIGDARG